MNTERLDEMRKHLESLISYSKGPYGELLPFGVPTLAEAILLLMEAMEGEAV